MASLNTFAGNAPKQDWLRKFFDSPADFFCYDGLGVMQRYGFGRFLRDAQLTVGKHSTPFAELVKSFGWDRESALGLMLINLAVNNVQIRWFIENLPLEKFISRAEVEAKLFSLGVTKNSARAIIQSFGRLSGTVFGSVLKFGRVMYFGRRLSAIKRTKTKVSDGRVILYALYKFAEFRGERQFTVNRLMEASTSPAKIFCLEREELEQFLNGLSANYPEYLDATFTHDLEKISLMPDIRADDILKIFEG